MNDLFNPNSQNSGILSRLVSGFIRNPGDFFSAEMTPSHRQVIKLATDNIKYSATRYSNGTIVETRTIRPE